MTPNVRKKKWVEQLLTKRDKIEKAIGMPLGTMLGCGHWGCVFESTPPWVVKLSIDPTEGPIWSKIMGLVSEEQYGALGFPEIKSLHRITPDLVTPGGRKKKVWAIVREGVEPVLRAVRGERSEPTEFTFKALRVPEGAPFDVHSGDYTKQMWDEQGIAWTSQVEDFFRALEGLSKYQMLAREWHERKKPRGRRYLQFSLADVSLADVEYRINRVVETMFNGPACAPLGESLNMLASHGVYLRDVHLMNIGWHVARDDDDWDRIVIFDPGHTPTAAGKDIEEALVENRRVYHGTPRVFAMSDAWISEGSYGPGFYLTTEPREAKWYAERVERAKKIHSTEEPSEPTIVECEVDLRNPINYYDLFPEDVGRPAGVSAPSRSFTEHETLLRRLIRLDGVYGDEAAKQLQELGYDGIIVDLRKSSSWDDRTYYIVFDPTSLSCERQLIGREAL
jgi:hypothetical protein